MKKGFALIATLLIMTLLVVLAFAMMSLSSSTVRSTSATGGMAEAQANARLALMMALGELQTHAGSDMRITAPADILDEDNPPLLGVWRSWEGTDHDTVNSFTNTTDGTMIGRPKAPDYASKTASDGRFVSWLVSGAGDNSLPADAASLVSSIPTDDTIPLVWGGTLGWIDPAANPKVSKPRQVHVIPQFLNDENNVTTGKYAWWISGENQKARLPKPQNVVSGTVADWSAIISNHAVADPEVFGLESLLVDASPAEKTFSLSTADIYTNTAASIRPGESFHDLSPSSIGLLTNVATGGWRKDLSLLTERWNEQPDGNNELALFQLSPDESLLYTRATALNTIDNSTEVPKNMVYHWSNYAYGSGNESYNNNGPICSWSSLANWATFYKTFSPTATIPSMTALSYSQNVTYSQKHDVTVVPKLARLELILSHYSFPSTDPAHLGKLIPSVLYTPVVTIWNPYNVAIQVNQNYVNAYFHNALPIVLQYEIDNAPYPKTAVQKSAVAQYSALEISENWMINLRLYGTSAADPYYTLQPGETKVFSPAANTRTKASLTLRAVTMTLRPNYRNGVGFYFPLNRMLSANPGLTIDNAGNNVFAPSTPIKVEEVSIDSGSNKAENCGAYGQFNFGGGNSFIDIQYPQTEANTLFPPLTELISELTLDACRDPKPFLSFQLGTRSANPDLQASKGLVQSNPTKTRVTPGGRTQQRNDQINYNYPGGQSLINSAWDYSIEAFSDGPGGTLLPDVGLTTDLGYIISGSRKSDGISRCVLAEIPTRPISSLGDLSHWDVRGLNGFPPFVHNIIGNSDATPLVAADQVHVPYEQARNPSNRYIPKENMQNDDSYILNHIFFDDWFVSSIAPQPTGFGSGGGTFEDTYMAFVQGTTELANRAYKAIPEDLAGNATDAATRYVDNVQPVDSWKTVASRLEVEGMFNVNSTSVKAWRALLGHARNQKIPHFNTTGNDILLSDPTDYAVTKTNISGDEKAGTVRPGEYIGTTEFTGYRVLEDDILDMLAEEVVKQVRRRGPFLSLSEFVNRKLTADSTEEDLALGGAIQAALNALTADTSLNPFADLQDESNPSVANPIGIHDYKFPQAAVGHSSYGLPGWTRQVDILRPLAPVLSARDDTFTIRAYGESVDANGTVARAWCEAIVKRTKDFVDHSENADITGVPVIEVNKTYGRRFEMISFRWLNPDEV